MKATLELTKDERKRAAQILTSITAYKMRGLPVPPLRPEDKRICEILLKEKRIKT